MKIHYIKEIFANEKQNIENINATDIWTGKTQEVIYTKYKLLSTNFEPIEGAFQIYIDFLKKVLQDYQNIENYLNQNIEENITNIDINS